MADRTELYQSPGAPNATFYRKNRQDDRRTSGQVLYYVESGVARASDLVTVASSKLPEYYPGDPDLPILEVTAHLYDSGDALLVGVYGRSSAAEPTQYSFDLAEINQFGRKEKKEHRIISFDLPDGALGVRYAVRSDTTTYGLTEIRVPYALDENPEIYTADMVNKINSDTVSIRGVDRGPKTLRYEGVADNPLDSDNALRYTGYHVFTWFAQGWTKEELNFNPGGLPICSLLSDDAVEIDPGEWDIDDDGVADCTTNGPDIVADEDEYDAVVFANKFPCNGITGGFGPEAGSGAS